MLINKKTRHTPHNKKFISGIVNSYERLRGKKCIRSYNHMSAVVESSFFRPRNFGFFNSKLGWAADANRTIN